MAARPRGRAAVVFVGLIATWLVAIAGGVVVALRSPAGTGPGGRRGVTTHRRRAGLPRRAHAAPGWWGMLLLIATEATLFALLLASLLLHPLPDAGGVAARTASPPLRSYGRRS